jgi:hypothetical protein
METVEAKFKILSHFQKGTEGNRENTEFGELVARPKVTITITFPVEDL